MCLPNQNLFDIWSGIPHVADSEHHVLSSVQTPFFGGNSKIQCKQPAPVQFVSRVSAVLFNTDTERLLLLYDVKITT